MFQDSLPANLDDLRQRGYRYWEQSTSDCCRQTSYYLIGRCHSPDDFVSNQSTDLVFAVLGELRFELFISDDPDVPTADNYNYSFNGARFSVFSLPWEDGDGIKHLTLDDLHSLGTRVCSLDMRVSNLPAFESTLQSFTAWPEPTTD